MMIRKVIAYFGILHGLLRNAEQSIFQKLGDYYWLLQQIVNVLRAKITLRGGQTQVYTGNITLIR